MSARGALARCGEAIRGKELSTAVERREYRPAQRGVYEKKH
jgi:hypothetical protein